MLKLQLIQQKRLRSNDNEDFEQKGEKNTDDDKSFFDLTAPSPPKLPRQNSFDLILETYDWKETPGCLSLELREFNRLENTLVLNTENQLGTQEYEESL